MTRPLAAAEKKVHRHGAAPAVRSAASKFQTAAPFLGSLLAFASLPPLNCWPLAFVAPVPWLLLVRRQTLPGRRPYRMLWLAGATFWLLALHWLRLPHFTTVFGWLALSAYLGCYLPLFVALTRFAVHRWKLSAILAPPVVWTGLELAQAHLFTGFSMASLGHTQYRWLALIQIADLVGAYGVTFVVLFVAACLARSISRLPAGWTEDADPLSPSAQTRRLDWRPLAPAICLLAACLAYGAWRLDHEPGPAGPRVALLQGVIDTDFSLDPSRPSRMLTQYEQLARSAKERSPDLDLIVWPESMFPLSHLTYDPDVQPLPHEDWQAADLIDTSQAHRAAMQSLARSLGTPLMLGVGAYHYGRTLREHFTSAIHVDPQSGVADRYDKIHLVMFGEYVPFADWLPWLYRFTPLDGGVDVGQRVPSFEIGGSRFAVSICYETVCPHFIRGSVRQLIDRGEPPDVLLNITNSGWFWGSSELDLHLMCGVFRALECRTPLLVAANTGFSAWIDGDGRIVQRGLRRQQDILLCQPRHDPRGSLYLRFGDWFAGACLAACIVLAAGCLRANLARFHRNESTP